MFIVRTESSLGLHESTPGPLARPRRAQRRWTGRTSIAAVLLCGVFLPSCGDRPLDIDSLGRATQEELARDRDAQRQEERIGVIQFGFDVRASPEEDAEQYLPLLRYLEQATGYDFGLRFTRAGSTLVDDLGSGRVQVAAVGAGTFLRARARHGVTPLVRGVNLENKTEYHSVIVTAPDSELRTLSDLRGKRFAFGSFTSTQGHLIPRILLLQNEVAVSQLAGYEFAGSHREAAEAVITGRTHAAGVQDTIGEELTRAGLLRIIHTSDPYPSSGIVAGPGLDAGVAARIKQALLAFEPRSRHAEGLHDWEKTEMPNGFVEASVEDYVELEFWARKFGLLESKVATGA